MKSLNNESKQSMFPEIQIIKTLLGLLFKTSGFPANQGYFNYIFLKWNNTVKQKM